MSGIEKRIARFPQFYSRLSFVHEFRPLDATQLQKPLEQRWVPVGVTLPDEKLLAEVVASLIRMTGGNFRLLTRLLTQIERVLDVNAFIQSRRRSPRRHATAWSLGWAESQCAKYR
jgi:hypothetical protein